MFALKGRTECRNHTGSRILVTEQEVLRAVSTFDLILFPKQMEKLGVSCRSVGFGQMAGVEVGVEAEVVDTHSWPL